MKLTEITDEAAEAIKAGDKPTGKPAETAPATSATARQEPATTTQDEAKAKPAPVMGPEPAAPRQRIEDILKDLNKSPLFMTDLENEEENEHLAALQALAYEGTPLENAGEMKEQGNESFKIRRWADAKESYDKGINILWHEERKRARGEITTSGSEDGTPDSEETIREQKKLLETMYVNRAACQLELGNYRSCWLDCGAALRLNPRNVKAWYRSGKALLKVDRIEEADDACARGLALDEGNKALKALAADIIKRHEFLVGKKRADEEREGKARRRANLLAAAIKAREIRTKSTEKPPEMEDASIKLVPDEDDPRSSLVFPTVLLYPLHFESDFIKAFGETETLADHLGYVFPLPWDTKGEYTLAGVECYVETVTGGLVKMGKKVPLLKVLAGGKVEVVDQVVKIFVVPRAGAEAWVKTFKEQRAKEAAGKA